MKMHKRTGLFLALLTLLFSHITILAAVSVDGSDCNKASDHSCGECLQIGQHCGWCRQEDYKNSRCDEITALLTKGCLEKNVVNPRGWLSVIENKTVTNRKKDVSEKLKPSEITQIQPQKLEFNLRSGEAQSFELKFKRAEDYPIDLYYLMDLSHSMEKDLQNVKTLGSELAREMQDLTSDLRIGFGAFLEKLVMPFVIMTPKKLANPCSSLTCARPFSYKNVLSLTSDGQKFSNIVSKQTTSANLDSPEGGFDAIMQAVVCNDIGWRNVTKLLVFSTDAAFHFAGDGKLAGLVLPNDGKCYLENNEYTKSDYFDYPTVSQLAETLSENNIQTIFAVTNDVKNLYLELSELIPKSAVGTLSANSSNVIQLIINAYNSLSSEVILENTKLPNGVSISYVSHCKNGVSQTGDSGRRCANISIGDEVTFDVSITTKGCPSDGKKETVKIKPLGFNEEVLLELNYICECDCHKDGIPNSPNCSSNGAYECGACRCKEGHIGKKCECSRDQITTEDLDANCRMNNSTDVCSKNGRCLCGVCECEVRENPEEVIDGKFCECDNFNCERSAGKLCGGHGKCVCKKCICDPNYTGSACECPLGEESCISSNGKICNGHGSCECGQCKCNNSKYSGPTCEICDTCPGVCEEIKACVQCRLLDTGKCDTECYMFNMTKVEKKEDLPKTQDEGQNNCKVQNFEDCWLFFRHIQKKNLVDVIVAEKVECPSGPDLIPIVGGVIGGVVLIGLALLLIWKLIMIIRDRQEFEKFMKENEKARWNATSNPIYRSAVTTVQNPQYKGN